MDRMQATPRRFPAVGGLADFLAAGTSPQRTQQMRGLMEFLQVPDIAATLDRVSYGEPLTTGRGMTTQMRPETENTLMAALGMTPVGKPAQAGAMALGRVGERVAERVVPQVMERGGLPAEMLSAMAQGTQSPATVFHGTPHLFRRFDSSKIGTGEGAQAFGHGLYLAEAPGVASDYRKNLSANTFVTDKGGLLSQKKLMDMGFDRGDALVTLNALKQSDGDAKKAADLLTHHPHAAKFLRGLSGLSENKGYLYQVDLPDEQIARMMDWDKPISQQPKVMRALRKEAEARVKSRLLPEIENELRSKTPLQSADDGGFLSLFNDSNAGLNKSIQEQAQKRLSKMNLKSDVERELDLMKPADMTWDMSGKNFYETMTKRQGSDVDVSKMLAKQNIPGIRYLDQGSRGTSGGEILGVVKDGDSWRARVRVDNRAGVGFDTPTQIVTKSKPYKTKEEAQKWAEQATGQGTSNFVVFPGMEDMLRIEQINNQPVESLFRSLGR